MLNGNGGRNKTNGAGNGNRAQRDEVVAYLAQLGLEAHELGKIAALLDAIQHQENPGAACGLDPTPPPQGHDVFSFGPAQDQSWKVDPSKPAQGFPIEALLAALDWPDVRKAAPVLARPQALAIERALKLYVAEEQEIYKLAYQSFFDSHPSIELLEICGDASVESLRAAADRRPDVVLVGVKALNVASAIRLGALAESCPGAGLVLIFASYDAKGIRALKELCSKEGSGGRAYLQKHNLNTLDELTQVVFSVAEGRIILDPTIMGELIGEGGSSPFTDLSRREMEVLSWMARGYGDGAIASVLCRDVKAVQRQVADIYGKLGVEEDRGDCRVSAALLFLKAAGLMPAA